VNSTWTLILFTLGFSVFGLLAAAYLARWVLRKDTGTPEMRKISDAIKEGAEAFLKRQNSTILLLSLFCAIFIFVGYGIIRKPQNFDPVQNNSIMFAM
jgi:Na+/H+-translocating membrane pyrophosphatase